MAEGALPLPVLIGLIAAVPAAVLLGANLLWRRLKAPGGPVKALAVDQALPTLRVQFSEVSDVGGCTALVPLGSVLVATRKAGELVSLNPSTSPWESTVLVDLRKTDPGRFIFDGMETGLLSVAVHPTDASRLFLCFSVRAVKGMNLVVREYSASVTSRAAVRVTRGLDRYMVNFAADIHHGGTLAFGPPGTTLYLGTGDGGKGGQGDPFNLAQNRRLPQGKMLAFDVDTDVSPWEPRHVALGLRNPWRFSVDRNGIMFIGDVGLAHRESVYRVDVVSVPPGGYNFGWSVWEGSHRHKAGPGYDKFEPPIFEYHTGSQGRAVIGGYRLAPGVYLFGDWTGWVAVLMPRVAKRLDGDWEATPGSQTALPTDPATEKPDELFSFGEDAEGVVYALGKRAVYRVAVSANQ